MAYGDPYDPTAPQQGGLLNYFGNVTQNPLFGAGLGLLSTVGPSLTPKAPFAGLAEGLAFTTQAQKAAQENALTRAKLAENQRQIAAQSELAKYVSESPTPLVPGLPNAVVAAGLAADPSSFSKLLQPMTPQDALAKAQLAKLTTEQNVAHSEAERNVAKVFSAAGDMSGALDALEGKVLEPGQPGVKLTRDVASIVTGAADVLGMGDNPTIAGLKDQVVNYDVINKLSAGLMQQLVSDLPGSRVGSNTMTLVGQATAGPGVSVGANRRIIISTLRDKIREAHDLGYNVDTAGAEKLITALEKSTIGGPTPSEEDVPAIGRARKLDQGTDESGAPLPPVIAGPPQPGEGPPTGDVNPGPITGTSGYKTVANKFGQPAFGAPTPPPPFNTGSAYVMNGPGVRSFASDLLAPVTGAASNAYAAAAPYVSEAAAPYIQQGSKAVAQATDVAKQAITKGKDVLSLAGRKVGELDASGTVLTLRNMSDKALLNTQGYLQKLYDAGIRSVVVGGVRSNLVEGQ